MELLDFAGPAEVFSLAGQFGPHATHEGAFNVYTVGVTAAPVVSQGFLTITPQFTIGSSPKPDIHVVPGGAGHGAAAVAPQVLEWMRGAAKTAEALLGACTGAFPLAKAGLLDGRRATTWSNAVSHLRHDAPRVQVVGNARVVDAGKVVTTGAVSTGIDGALHGVARLLGAQEAHWVADHLEYRWQPAPAASR